MKDRITGKMVIHLLALGMVRTNCYIVSNTQTREVIVIDPADNAEIIKEYIQREGLLLKGILLTHGHFDHILAASALASDFSTKVYVNEQEEELLLDSRMNCGANWGYDVGIKADVLLKDGDTLEIAGFTIKAMNTPGHTRGGSCYYFKEEKSLFAGDTLFRESVGRTDLPTSNPAAIIESIKSKLMKLEDDVEVYPGHGQFTTIGYERKNNPFL